MAQVFLSYRRADSEGTVGRIHERLSEAFGPRAIFHDTGSLLAGSDFRSAIEHALAASEVVAVVIGKQWLNATGPEGRRRLDDRDDIVRREVESALAARKVVIPILVDGASMPPADALPPSIRELAYRNAIEVRPGRDFQVDMQRLIAALEANTAALHDRHPAMSAEHQSVAMPLHFLIVGVFGLLALISIGGGIYAIAVRSTAQTTLVILGAELRTEHVGVALVGIGFIIAFLTVRSVLKSQHDLARLSHDRK